MRFPSPECYTTFWIMTIYSDTLHWSGITPIVDHITELDLITEFDFLPNLQQVRYANRGRLLLRDLVMSHFRTRKYSKVETNLSWTSLVSGFLNFEHPLVLFLLKRKRKKSDSVLWQKPFHRQKNPKSNVTTQKRHQKLRLHNHWVPP